jgi:hypothetical protein
MSPEFNAVSRLTDRHDTASGVSWGDAHGAGLGMVAAGHIGEFDAERES